MFAVWATLRPRARDYGNFNIVCLQWPIMSQLHVYSGNAKPRRRGEKITLDRLELTSMPGQEPEGFL